MNFELPDRSSFWQGLHPQIKRLYAAGDRKLCSIFSAIFRFGGPARRFFIFYFNFFYCSFDTQDLISEFSVYAKVVQRGSCCLILLLLFETSIYIMEEIVNGALSSLRPILD